MAKSSTVTFKQDKPVERLFVLFTILATANLVAFHLIAAIIRLIVPGLPLAAWPITYAAILAAVVFTFAAPRLSHILPKWLDGSSREHPVRSMLFVLMALVTIVQIARLSTHKTDPTTSWWVLTTDEAFSEHECGTAYFHAVELHDRGEQNVYLADHYPILNRAISPHTEIEGLRVEDAYQYPPQFLLLPKMFLTFTNDFPTIRIIWFSLQFIGIAAVFLMLAHWVGGIAGRWMAMLAPLVIVSPAALYAYQYTQFHFIAIALGIGGMLAFEKKRNALGGALLAAATLGKIFPGFLIILLLAEKRWKPVLWTAVFGVAFTLTTLVVFGVAPFTAFFNYQLPRLQSFAAFAFLDTWPEMRTMLIADNFSPYGQIIKLNELGIPGMTKVVAKSFNTLFTLILVGLAINASRHLKSRVNRVYIWLAIVGLGSMMSPGAWGDYISLPAMWLLTVLAAEYETNRKMTIAFVICWILFYFLIGTMPFSSSPVPKVTYIVSTINFISLTGLLVWVMLRSPRQEIAIAD